ncbi:beta-ketoacyl-[acyl-carrier-protein] synthase family protein [Phytohabitans houttuyneae]|uniref:beta-ketoacyl-[acyl-carrier-protein] synthase family protein n=2 Tax=Phytohabitans houttuyneae TaxID=1076126 RepID=UPI0031EB24D0
MQHHDVAIVAAGAVTAQGRGASSLWDGARAGRVAIRPVTGLDMSGYGTKLAGEVTDLEEAPHAYRRPEGFRERVVELALHAAAEALDEAPALVAAAGGERAGVVFGTCNAGLIAGREWLAALERDDRPDPLLATLVPPQATAEALAGAFGLGGPVLSVNTACASGANAIGWAADLIRTGRADLMLAGGADALSDVCFAGFSSLEALASEPARPYSRGRQGLSLGEGGVFLLLARADLAAAHGPAPIAYVAGYGLSADGYHPTAPRPDGSGAARAIRTAMRLAGVAPADVGYLNGHGTGTDKNDPAETKAIRLALGEAANGLAVSSTKSVIGHLLGAAGAAEALVTARALACGVAPPTASYLGPDRDCDLDYVPIDARPVRTDVALSNNFAFGGSNACLALTRAGSGRRPPAPDLDAVVVTGLAVLGPAGDGVAAAQEAVSRKAPLTGEVAGVRVGTMALDPEPYLSRKARRRMDRLTVASIVASAKALADAKLPSGADVESPAGIVFGTGAGPVEAMARFTRPLLAEGAAAADPGWFPNTVYNQAAGQVAQHLGLRGPTSTVSTGHASGATALAYGYDLLRLGHCEALVCTATDIVDDLVVRAYRDLGLLSLTPGDHRLPLAEGSVAVVLERRRHAQARSARVLAEITGYGAATHVVPGVDWDRDGVATGRAMRAALADGGAEPADVSALWLAAAGLSVADQAERRAAQALFGDRMPARHAPKSVLGEPLGASGALCFALAAADLATADPDTGPALVNSMSLGGASVSLLLRTATHEEVR